MLKKLALLVPAVASPACVVHLHGPLDRDAPLEAWDLDNQGGAPTIVKRWQLPTSSPWAPYSKFTVATAFDEAGPRPVWRPPRAEVKAAAQALAKGLQSDTLLLVELPGAESVLFTAALSKAASVPVAPVLTFNNWPAEDELIPTSQIVDALVASMPRLPDASAKAAPVFMLDADRLEGTDEVPVERRYDNRYALYSSDFPNPAVLQAQGIRRVVYLVGETAEGPVEEDDLNPLLLSYQRSGLELTVLPLDGLLATPPAQPWSLAAPLKVVERPQARVAELESFRTTVGEFDRSSHSGGLGGLGG